MRVKPEDLRVANKVAGVKESGTASAKKNYWVGVHRLVMEGGKLKLKTTDNSVWVEWVIPFEEEPIEELDILVSEKAFDNAARHLDGGSLDFTLKNNTASLCKGRLHYRIRIENPQVYPEPKPGKDPVVWTANSRLLAKALRFVAPFINETNPDEHKSVATLYPTGVLAGGNPRRIASAKGLTAKAILSFKMKTARIAAEFLNNIGENVEVSVAENSYKFVDPVNGHSLVILAQTGQFPLVEKDLSTIISEVNHVDRKMLLQRAKAFAGPLPLGVDRINLSFRGEDDTASLRVHTPGDNEDEITDDEFGILREFTENTDERGPVDFSVNREFLADSLEQMEGTNVVMRVCKRMVLIEDEIGMVTEGEEATEPAELEPERSVLLGANKPVTTLEVEEKVEEKSAEVKVEAPAVETTEVAAGADS